MSVDKDEIDINEQKALIKQLKKEAHQLMKNSSRKRKDQHGIRVEKLQKTLKKFMKIYEEELEDFYDIFQQLDDGGEIETSAIENIQIRKRLEKIFEVLKIQNIGKSKDPKYKHHNKELKLVTYVREQIETILDSSSSLGEDLSDIQNTSQPKFPLTEVTTSQVPTTEIPTTKHSPPNQKQFEPPVKKYGVTLPQKDDGNQDEMDKFLNTEFSSKHKSKLTSFLNQRITTNPQLAELQKLQRVKKNPLVSAEITYLGGKLEDKQSQEELHEYMRKWDDENRGSSLMALHQQKRREEKALKMRDEPQINQRKAFDRDTDLGMSKQDSKSIMKELKQGGNALTSKFSSGNVLNSFI